MANIKIKEAELATDVTGTFRVPVSDGSDLPKTVTLDQIGEVVSPKNISELTNDMGYLTSVNLEDGSTVLGVEEAPVDNKQYVRCNGEWQEVMEVVFITLTASNGYSLVGQIITVTIGDEVSTYVYNDTPVIINIPRASIYTIEVDSKDGFFTPGAFKSQALKPSRDVDMLYIAISQNTTTFDDTVASTVLNQGEDIDTSWIKGKRCLVKKTDTGVAICYLDNNNSELFHDGVTVAALDGSMGQWMTDIPEYWYSMDESIENTHALTLANSEQTNWKHSRRVLLGVTKAYNVDGILWSKCDGVIFPTVSLSPKVFHQYATACGDGFDIIDYESHQKIAHLFYAKYANLNPQGMTEFGNGQNSTQRIMGTTASLGNNDGKTSTQISFLGIEDFYGCVNEWMGGIHGNGSLYYIYDGYEPDQVPTVNYRTIDVGGEQRSGYVSKVAWGEYADIIPTEALGSSSTYYSDYGGVAYSGWRAVNRSDKHASADGGVACFHANGGSGNAYGSVGSRLQYRGEITVIEDPAEFISLPVGF